MAVDYNMLDFVQPMQSRNMRVGPTGPSLFIRVTNTNYYGNFKKGLTFV